MTETQSGDTESPESIIPEVSELTPLTICSNHDYCVIYDVNGGVVYEKSIDDIWAYPDRIFDLVIKLIKAYEEPEELLTESLKHEYVSQRLQKFYQSRRQSRNGIEGSAGPIIRRFWQLPPFTEEIPPAFEGVSPVVEMFDIRDEDGYYCDDEPPIIRIVDGDEVLEEWEIKEYYTPDLCGDFPHEYLVPSVVWNIRIAYERPWLLYR